jgi:hypothetical protein
VRERIRKKCKEHCDSRIQHPPLPPTPVFCTLVGTRGRGRERASRMCAYVEESAGGRRSEHHLHLRFSHYAHPLPLRPSPHFLRHSYPTNARVLFPLLHLSQTPHRTRADLFGAGSVLHSTTLPMPTLGRARVLLSAVMDVYRVVGGATVIVGVPQRPRAGLIHSPRQGRVHIEGIRQESIDRDEAHRARPRETDACANPMARG